MRRRGLHGERRHGTQEEELVQLYLNDIGRHPLLTREEEAALAETIKEGRAAAAELVTQHPLPAPRREALEARVRAGEEAAARFVQ